MYPFPQHPIVGAEHIQPSPSSTHRGIKYFKSDQKHMEGCFGDWMIEEGKEYYENGNLRFSGQYNKDPRSYYGPRHFVEGKLYYDTGELWYEGTFNVIRVGSMGYPVFRAGESFKAGTEYDKQGNVFKHRSKC